jgi:ribosome maturation factor RimP
MTISHLKLHGLDADRVTAAVEPVLRAHGVDGVELVWRTDQGGWVLELTVERPDARTPGAGVTIDLCSEISRDLSVALDVADAIPHRYRLDVGSPGLERALYIPSDYARFAGQRARVKLRAPIEGQHVLHGTLHGLDEQGRLALETERGLLTLALDEIDSARLVFDWNTGGSNKGIRARSGKAKATKASRASADRRRDGRRSQRSR